jgi:hypothetical protein
MGCNVSLCEEEGLARKESGMAYYDKEGRLVSFPNDDRDMVRGHG